MSSGLLIFLNLDSSTLRQYKAHTWLALGPACLFILSRLHSELQGQSSSHCLSREWLQRVLSNHLSRKFSQLSKPCDDKPILNKPIKPSACDPHTLFVVVLMSIF